MYKSPTEKKFTYYKNIILASQQRIEYKLNLSNRILKQKLEFEWCKNGKRKKRKLVNNKTKEKLNEMKNI